MSETPSDLLYAESHEWIRIDDDEGIIGITDHAQAALNDIVFVELPAVGDVIDQGEQFGVVESVKSVSDLYMPVRGEIIEVNEALEDTPELVNEDPYGDGWFIKIRIENHAESAVLLGPDDYARQNGD